MDTARDATPDDNDNEEDGANKQNAGLVPPPTVDIALKVCYTFRQFLQQQTDTTDILEKLCHVDK